MAALDRIEANGGTVRRAGAKLQPVQHLRRAIESVLTKT